MAIVIGERQGIEGRGRSDSFHSADVPVAVHVSEFTAPQAAREAHFMLCPTTEGTIQTQLNWMLRAYTEAVESLGLDMTTAVMRRFFCSDIVNQAGVLESFAFVNRISPDTPCALSWVGQPPMPPAKVALWAYHIYDPKGPLDKAREGTSLVLRRDSLAHHWTTGIVATDRPTVETQTRGAFEAYEQVLATREMSLERNVIRTWLFVENIDAHYGAMVSARRELFAERGMTPDTHFIASTGVEGSHADTATMVSMDAYAISGLRRDQIAFLSAPDHLSPTCLYGVTFERATSVAYRDRTHVYVSGTASIDRHGHIVHQGDVSRQLDHTLENVRTLLHRAEATLEDIVMCIVYVRDPSDFDLATQQMRARFPHTPATIVLSPVCRPGWLIEVEAIAVVPACNGHLPAF